MNITRRSAKKGDIEFARKTHHAAFKDIVIRQFGKWDEELQNKFFKNDIASDDFDIILFDGIPCGYACVEISGEFVHIKELVISPEFQGKGIGSLLLKSAIETAKTKNIPVKIEVLKQNQAKELYSRFGFRKYDETETHILMIYRQ